MLLRTLLALLVLAPTALPQGLGPELNFPGDLAVGAAPGDQTAPAIAPGGPGYLVVWEDERANPVNFAGAVGIAGAGNLIDIYAARYDSEGQLLDTTPIVVANQGMSQTDPEVAWNGTHWLVVFTTQRPDWYFFDDIVGVRIAADGTVLDPTPIMIRPENNSPANDGGQTPTVTSDGTNWFVAWKAYDYTNNWQVLEGVRIDSSGTVLDAPYKRLYTFQQFVFGPERPRLAALNGEVLMAWDDFGPVRVRRYDANFDPVSPVQAVPGLSSNVRLAASDAGYFLLDQDQGLRLAADGTPLDPAPITIPKVMTTTGLPANPDQLDVAWNGSSWSIGFGVSPLGSIFDDQDVYLVRIGADGVVLDPAPVVIDSGLTDDRAVRVAGLAGRTLFAFDSRPDDAFSYQDVGAALADSSGLPLPTTMASVGMARQEYLKWVENGDERLAVWVSRGAGKARILAQRFDANGGPLDLEPVLVHQGEEGVDTNLDATWNGTTYLIAWRDPSGTIFSRRLTSALGLVDFGIVPLMPNMDGPPAVGSLNGDYLVVARRITSNDISSLYATRIDGITGAPLESEPFLLAGNYSTGPVVDALGGNWIVAYNNRGCHDCNTDRVFVRRVTAAGGVSTAVQINGPGEGGGPDIAVAGDRALITYTDPSSFLQNSVEARILMADGTLPFGEVLLSDAPNIQYDAAVCWDGNQFVAAWTDYRQVAGVEQLRGDVYMARLGLDGALLDPVGGVQVTFGELPEDRAEVTGGGGKALIAYSALGLVGGNPDVQRYRYRVLNGDVCQPDLGFGGPGTARLSVCGDALNGPTATAEVRIDSDVPLSLAVIGYGPGQAPTPLFGGTVLPTPLAGYMVLNTDITGDVSFTIGTLPNPAALVAQAVVVDPSQPGGFQITNAVHVTLNP